MLTFAFDAVFGDYMVLQQAPSQAAIYGYLPLGTGSGAAVTVTLTPSSGGAPVSVAAALNVTQQPYGDGWGVRPCPKAACPPYDMEPFTPWGVPLPSWKALLPAMPAGGDFIVAASCTGCNGSAPINVTNVTFGDVWYCSGQSNAWLPTLHTFSRNESAANASAGILGNVRVMAGSSGSVPYASWPNKYGGVGGSNPWMTAADYAPAGCVDKQNCPFFNVAGTCWYFATGLALRGINYPIGVIETAIGGQRIEEFMENVTINACTQRSGENIPYWDGQLYGQQVLMFVDFTIKGWIWYQGENNMGGTKGNSIANVGYGCEQRVLIEGWRSRWSAVPNTTDPLAPFGLVTLASSGNEGGPNMGAMRWAQTANAGVLPSPQLPNTFFAQAYDLDDPWGPAGGPCFFGSQPDAWACCEPKYNATTCAGREALCAVACAANADTSSVMGGIHPRNKRPVGERLAAAAMPVVYGGTGSGTGPTLAGCAVQTGAKSLLVSFNTTLLRGDAVVLQPIPAYLPPSRDQPLGTGGSQLWVQTNASLFCMEPQCVVNATTGQCPSGRGSNPMDMCPTWAGGDGVTQFQPGVLDSGWVQLNFTLAPSSSSASAAIEVDLTPLGGLVPTAVRYAWGVIDCCDHTDPNLYIKYGCMASCPIMSSSGLPANPFQAKIVAGTCQCVAPQVCDGGA